jgi:molecular chaperone DnaK (HSP70)
MPLPAPQVRNALPEARPGDFAPPAGWQNAPSPVLVDVTPRALVVETVGGFCDTVIPRNAKIPCEHTRAFATGRDLQTQVYVRVAQGEEQRFDKNQYLGELELSNLRPAPRGELTLSVTFELDANGSLVVRAIDKSTGQQAQASMKLIAAGWSDDEVEEMMERSRSVSVTG